MRSRPHLPRRWPASWRPRLPSPRAKPPADAAPPLPLDAYTGTYTNTRYGEVTVREEAGGLVLEYGSNGVQHRLFPWNRDAFSMPLTGADAAQIAQLGVLFTIGPDGSGGLRRW